MSHTRLIFKPKSLNSLMRWSPPQIFSIFNSSPLFRNPQNYEHSYILLARLRSDSSKSNGSTNATSEGKKLQGEKNLNASGFDDEYDSVQLTPTEKEKLFKFTKAIEENSYYAKYKSKIVNFQRSSPRAFLALVDQLLSSGKKQPPLDGKSTTLQNRKKLALDDVMKLSSLLSLEREDISFIWSEYHNSSEMVAAVMNTKKYDSIVQTATTFSTFVLPLPRKDQYEFFLAQYDNDSFYLTPLSEYHKYKENSPVCLTLSHFDELKEKKDLILLRGEYDKDIMNLKEARHLAVHLNCYYGETSERRLSILQRFSSNDVDFKNTDLIDELHQLQVEFPDIFPELN